MFFFLSLSRKSERSSGLPLEGARAGKDARGKGRRQRRRGRKSGTLQMHRHPSRVIYHFTCNLNDGVLCVCLFFSAQFELSFQFDGDSSVVGGVCSLVALCFALFDDSCGWEGALQGGAEELKRKSCHLIPLRRRLEVCCHAETVPKFSWCGSAGPQAFDGNTLLNEKRLVCKGTHVVKIQGSHRG